MTPWIFLIVGAMASAMATAQDKTVATANRADEPFATTFSLPKAIAFIDSAAQRWESKYNCVTCHTNGLYLASRAQVSTQDPAYAQARKFAASYLESYIVKNEKPKGQRGAIEGLVATTSFLTISDIAVSGKLSAITTKSLDYIWKQQDKSGAWTDWLKCKWPPFETDDHFGVTLAALALGHTPRAYRKKTVVQRAEQRLRSYLRKHPATNPHQKGMELWASTKLSKLVSKNKRKQSSEELKRLQRPDGGWRLVDLGKGQWKQSKDEAKDLPSDAYATGFTIFVLRQIGAPKDHPQIQKGLAWLRKNQRQSGRWFVRSPRRDGKHFITHAATQFAVMALVACDEGAAKK
jgi:squalene-hopene/tetraprenyl-beta-curcumene cyclase